MPSNSHSCLRNRHTRMAPFLLAVALVLFCGCKKSYEVDDPQLKPIQAMLEQSVPIGSNEAIVNQFLSSRGYPKEPSEKPGTIVTVIRHIDPERLQPVTARVTFYFDATGKLNTYEIVRTMNDPVPQ
jgi:hypothetical protein